MKSVQKGFTLIELMIVVAIIGILAAIAIPQYQDYTIRSKITEGLNMAAPAKLGVAETYASNGAPPADNLAAGISDTISSKYVSAVEVNNGVITVTLTGIHANVDGKIITLTPDFDDTAGRVDWTCTFDGDDKYVPANCRAGAAPAP
jgi:type IV pilus assembly protein PilA